LSIFRQKFYTICFCFSKKKKNNKNIKKEEEEEEEEDSNKLFLPCLSKRIHHGEL